MQRHNLNQNNICDVFDIISVLTRSGKYPGHGMDDGGTVGRSTVGEKRLYHTTVQVTTGTHPVFYSVNLDWYVVKHNCVT